MSAGCSVGRGGDLVVYLPDLRVEVGELLPQLFRLGRERLGLLLRVVLRLQVLIDLLQPVGLGFQRVGAGDLFNRAARG